MCCRCESVDGFLQRTACAGMGGGLKLPKSVSSKPELFVPVMPWRTFLQSTRHVVCTYSPGLYILASSLQLHRRIHCIALGVGNLCITFAANLCMKSRKEHSDDHRNLQVELHGHTQPAYIVNATPTSSTGCASVMSFLVSMRLFLHSLKFKGKVGRIQPRACCNHR